MVIVLRSHLKQERSRVSKREPTFGEGEKLALHAELYKGGRRGGGSARKRPSRQWAAKAKARGTGGQVCWRESQLGGRYVRSRMSWRQIMEGQKAMMD